MIPVIRLGVPADAAALAELAARTFSDTFAADNRPEDMAAHEAEAYSTVIQGRELADPNITTLIVELRGELAGFAQIRRAPVPDCVKGASPIELWRFYVTRNWHGRGIAPALMAVADAEAARAGGRTLWLGVWERNERAKAFYRKSGFTDVGTQQFVVGTDVQTERVMVRPIALAHGSWKAH
jgi:ribosomal protein S18 acetylase RimI-like enzyme